MKIFFNKKQDILKHKLRNTSSDMRSLIYPQSFGKQCCIYHLNLITKNLSIFGWTVAQVSGHVYLSVLKLQRDKDEWQTTTNEAWGTTDESKTTTDEP